MSKDILYYPTINFQTEDYDWLWKASLLWDKIYRIVPEGYPLDGPRHIQELCSTNEIGIPITPEQYSKEASEKFIKNLKEHKWSADALSMRKCNKYTRIHKDKVDESLRNLMITENISLENNEWLRMPREIANQYMIYLATEIAGKNNLSLNTGNLDVWTAANFFLQDGNVQDDFYPGAKYIVESKAALAPVFINKLFPENILDISPKDILEFRTKRKDERARFQEELDSFCSKLSNADAPEVLNQILNDESKKVKSAVRDYKKSMNIRKAVKWGGYLTCTVTIAADVLGYIKFDDHVIQHLTSAGIGIGLSTGLIEKIIKLPQNPYSYLCQTESLIPGYFKQHNYNLYRKMEEFIND
ncbi:MAG: hypothetical protein PHY39_05550 [Endomicrobiaceae bacterium]|nr:hypothetical protein [Endomicrobiaceae bacterium]